MDDRWFRLGDHGRSTHTGERYDSATTGVDRQHAHSGSLCTESAGADSKENCPTKIQSGLRQDHHAHDPDDRDKNRPVVESWIAKDLKKLGQTQFSAVTGWVAVDLCPLSGIPLGDSVWDGKLGDKHYCPVGADIPERAKGSIKVLLAGWSPGDAEVTVSLTDEPGSRAIAGVKAQKTEKGMPYVAVLIGPPPENPATATDGKK